MMNKEIEEILEDYDCTPELVELIKDKDEEIRDLEKENKKLKDRIHALEEHNKHLNKEAQKYFGMYMDREYAVKDTYDTANDIASELFKEKEELEERIDKAIKWLDYDNMEKYFECPKKEMKELLEILEGDE